MFFFFFFFFVLLHENMLWVLISVAEVLLMSTITYVFSGEIKKNKTKQNKKQQQKKTNKKKTNKKKQKQNKTKKKTQKTKNKQTKKKNKTKQKKNKKTNKQKTNKQKTKLSQCLVLRSCICDTLQCLFVAPRPHYVFFFVLVSEVQCASAVWFCLFVWFEVLRPSQPSGVMLSAVSLPNHTFTGQA